MPTITSAKDTYTLKSLIGRIGLGFSVELVYTEAVTVAGRLVNGFVVSVSTEYLFKPIEGTLARPRSNPRRPQGSIFGRGGYYPLSKLLDVEVPPGGTQRIEHYIRLYPKRTSVRWSLPRTIASSRYTRVDNWLSSCSCDRSTCPRVLLCLSKKRCVPSRLVRRFPGIEHLVRKALVEKPLVGGRPSLYEGLMY